jgi:hypothetical protein
MISGPARITVGRAGVRPQATPPASGGRASFIVTSYGVPNWTGQTGELDHRVPFSLGGTTGLANIWPEAGSIPNTKDKLEDYVHGRVCDSGRCGCGRHERSSWATGLLPSGSTA